MVSVASKLPLPCYVVPGQTSLLKRYFVKTTRALQVALIGLIGAVIAGAAGNLEEWLEVIMREIFNWIVMAVLLESAVETVAEYFVHRRVRSYVELQPTGLLAKALNLPIKDSVLLHLNPEYWAVYGNSVLVKEATEFYTVVIIDLSLIGVTVAVYRVKPEETSHEPLDRYVGVKLKHVQGEMGKQCRKQCKHGISWFEEFKKILRSEFHAEKTKVGELVFPSPTNPYTLVKCKGPVVRIVQSVFHLTVNPLKLENKVSDVASRALNEAIIAFKGLHTKR